MYNNLLKLAIILFISIFINGCSTVSDKLNIEDLVNKTEEFFFGESINEDEESIISETNNIALDSKNDSSEKEEVFPEIVTVPEVMPEFPEIDKNFFEGEVSLSDNLEDDGRKSKNFIPEETENAGKEIISINQKTILAIIDLSATIRLKVRSLLAFSDPPTDPKAQKISFQDNSNQEDIAFKLNKIAIIQFPNNSIRPDKTAEEVLNEIVKVYKSNNLKLIGHASRSGGNKSNARKVNMEISYARANTIKEILIEKGFLNSQITIEGRGDIEPLSDNTDSLNNAAADRRVEIFFITE